MFRRVADIWKCIALDAHCGYFGPMCSAPPRIIYWGNCHKDIITYDFDTNVLKSLYRHVAYIQHLFWYQRHLYFIDDQGNIYRMDDTYIFRVGVLQLDKGPLISCWNDEDWNVYAQNSTTIFRFNGEGFNVDTLGPIRLSEDKNILVSFENSVITISLSDPETLIPPHIIGKSQRENSLILYTETYDWNKMKTFLTKRILNNGRESTHIILTEAFPSRCLNLITEEIYVIDEHVGQYYLSIYEYPLKSLLDLCIDVIKREKELRLEVVNLPEELRDRFSQSETMT